MPANGLPVLWPACSPNLAPLNFDLWSQLKYMNCLFIRRFTDKNPKNSRTSENLGRHNPWLKQAEPPIKIIIRRRRDCNLCLEIRYWLRESTC